MKNYLSKIENFDIQNFISYFSKKNPFGTIISLIALVFLLSLYFTIPTFYNYENFDKEIQKKVSKENAKLNRINKVNFRAKGLEDLSSSKKFNSIVANIQSDILQKHSSALLNLMCENGTLILSGILTSEKAIIKSHFENKIKKMSLNFKTRSETMNE